MVQAADKAAEQVRNRNGDDIFLYAAAHFAQTRTGAYAREGAGSGRSKIILLGKPHNFSLKEQKYWI